MSEKEKTFYLGGPNLTMQLHWEITRFYDKFNSKTLILGICRELREEKDDQTRRGKEKGKR